MFQPTEATSDHADSWAPFRTTRKCIREAKAASSALPGNRVSLGKNLLHPCRVRVRWGCAINVCFLFPKFSQILIRVCLLLNVLRKCPSNHKIMIFLFPTLPLVSTWVGCGGGWGVLSVSPERDLLGELIGCGSRNDLRHSLPRGFVKCLTVKMSQQEEEASWRG